MESIAIVWHRRDLRIHDHRALAAALDNCARVIPVFILDDAILKHPLTSMDRVRYMFESLSDLRDAYARRHCKLVLRHGTPHEELVRLCRETGATQIYFHEDTDRKYGRERDDALAGRIGSIAECFPIGDNGVFTGSGSRVGWPGRWEKRMREPICTPPDVIQSVTGIESLPIYSQEHLGLVSGSATHATPGGERWARRRLDTWSKGETVYGGVGAYGRNVSRPYFCERGATSRLSAPLSFGCISLRTVVQASWKMQEANPGCKGRTHWHSRLVWHDHFTQKLRDFPDAQYENINPVYDSIRQELDAEMFARWTEGQTGFPMVDACMRALKQTGFLNFRMRAMVASFLTYLLWQPWQPGAEWFQRCLIDFDTGINHQQWQMQAGTVGWHANRFYDPVLQAEKFDPEGLFIDKYVPELRAIPMPQKAAPWRMSASDIAKSGVVLGVDYPLPMIDRNAAVRRARREFSKISKDAWAYIQTPDGIKRASGAKGHPPPARISKEEKAGVKQLTMEM